MKREDIDLNLITVLVKGYLTLYGFDRSLYKIGINTSDSSMGQALDGFVDAIVIIFDIPETDDRDILDEVLDILSEGETVEDTVECLLKLLD